MWSILVTNERQDYPLFLQIILELVNAAGTNNNTIISLLQLAMMLKPTMSSFRNGNPLLVLIFQIMNYASCTQDY